MMTIFRKAFLFVFLPAMFLACALPAHATQSSTTTVTATPNPVAVGQSITLKATVTGAAGTPTGSATFFAGSTSLGKATLNGSGVASLAAPTSSLSPGSYSITATYAGNSTYSASTSAAYTITVTKAVSTTTVTAMPNPVSAGHTVTLHVAVSGADGTATGSVNFDVGDTVIATVPLSNGAASLTAPTTGLAAGSYVVTADYLGSTDYSASSGDVTVVISKALTTTKLAASPNPVVQPAKCTLTATVTRSAAGESGVPTGTVTFKVGRTSLGDASLNASGVAALSAPSSLVSAGTYPVTAVYAGDSADLTSTSSSVSVTVDAAPEAYAYTLNSNLNTQGLSNISAFDESSSNGNPTLLASSPFQDGLTTPVSMAVDSQLGLLFAAGDNGGSQSMGEIVAMPINSSTGNLGTPVVTIPEDIIASLAVGPDGKFLFASFGSSESIAVYSVAASGALTEISGSPFTLPAANCGFDCPATANQMAYDAVNKNLYVVSSEGWIVATFTVDTSTGTLTWVYNEGTAEGPNNVAVNAAGTFVYATNGAGSGGVSAYMVTPNAMSNGNPEPLTQITGSPFATGAQPNSVAINPTGTYLYVTNSGDNTISAYQINSTSGALTEIEGSPFALGGEATAPSQIAVDPSGNYVYVSCQSFDGGSDGVLTAYSITKATGALTALSGSPYSLGTNANSALQVGFYKPQ